MSVFCQSFTSHERQHHSSWASQCGSRQGGEFSKVSRDWSFWAPARPQRREALQNGVPMSSDLLSKKWQRCGTSREFSMFFFHRIVSYYSHVRPCPGNGMSLDFWGQGLSSLRPVLSAIPGKLMTLADLGIAHARVSLGSSLQQMLRWNLFLPKNRWDMVRP